MGWQSFVLLYSTKEEREKVINAIKEHNDEHRGAKEVTGAQAIKWRCEAVGEDPSKHNDDFTDCEAGEDLDAITEATVKLEDYDTDEQKTSKAILCGNGGGRSYTFQFFRRRNIDVRFYESEYVHILEQTPLVIDFG